MESQAVFNIVVGISGALGGWVGSQGDLGCHQNARVENLIGAVFKRLDGKADK